MQDGLAALKIRIMVTLKIRSHPVTRIPPPPSLNEYTQILMESLLNLKFDALCDNGGTVLEMKLATTLNVPPTAVRGLDP